jgi:hypothetical protein
MAKDRALFSGAKEIRCHKNSAEIQQWLQL